jgi:formylglycine-generating enzyme required for sulfatase activity
MTRQNYGTLRGGTGGGRRGGGAWQWTVIGFVFGFMCAAAVGLALLIGGVTEGISAALGGAQATPTVGPSQTAVVMVITATPEPITPTAIPTTQEAQVAVPTASPTSDPLLIPVQSTPTLTPSATPEAAVPNANPQTNTVNQQASPQTGGSSQINPAFAALRSDLRRIDGGTFAMGTTTDELNVAVQECTSRWEATCEFDWGTDSLPQHNVTLDTFFIESGEVTYRQYMSFLNNALGTNPRRHQTGCLGQPCIETRADNETSNIIFDTTNYRVNDAILDYPVVGVTWYGAQAYCQSLGRRLPTEAEWERAARWNPANQSLTLYPWGNAFEVTFARTSRPREENQALVGPVAVESYPPGNNGTYDMAGNVAEWVSDWYIVTYYTEQAALQNPLNPSGPPVGTDKVVRGGSWDAVPFFSRSVHRQNRNPLAPTSWIGFRCANAIDDTTQASGAAPSGVTSGVPGVVGNQTPIGVIPGTGGDEEGQSSAATVPPPPPGS